VHRGRIAPIGRPPRRLRRLPQTEVLGFTVPVAVTANARLLGLALLDRGSAGEGLLIPRCGSVHTFGMRFALDLVFLTAEGRVLELRREVGPGRIARYRGADSVLELPTR
jgi:uncharacterized membrane protein (UPF0127 family)